MEEHLTPSEAESAYIDRYIAEVARKEQDDINAQHRQFILDALDARGQQTNAFIDLLSQAWKTAGERNDK